ncbi:hypothetical protein N7468_010626 [Penicillium chermesinum]|uniref:Uncharacterized protein n=1 Tax=Penicillium chermesinum TaxID=63820 RepID=A0A9W9N7Z6_9EURO|nr:uncharacterized protein N7468_010626 [Penicillium chermesinum]KAJ5214947.1 hypothetical protein N7468_010626 [Penicillium chermesinum]
MQGRTLRRHESLLRNSGHPNHDSGSTPEMCSPEETMLIGFDAGSFGLLGRLLPDNSPAFGNDRLQLKLQPTIHETPRGLVLPIMEIPSKAVNCSILHIVILEIDFQPLMLCDDPRSGCSEI